MRWKPTVTPSPLITYMKAKTTTSDQPTQLPHRSAMAAMVTAKGTKTAAMFTRRSRAVMAWRLPTVMAPFLGGGQGFAVRFCSHTSKRRWSRGLSTPGVLCLGPIVQPVGMEFGLTLLERLQGDVVLSPYGLARA